MKRFIGLAIVCLTCVGAKAQPSQWSQPIDFPSLITTYDVLLSTSLPMTPVYLMPSTGLLRVTLSWTVVTPATTGNAYWSVSWTDGDSGIMYTNGPRPISILAAVTDTYAFTCYAKAGSLIQLGTAFIGVTGTPVHSLHARLERL